MLTSQCRAASLSIIQIFTAIIFTALPLTFFLGYSSLIDLNTRLSANDSYIGTYYFWWTNLTYLPLFFFLLSLFIAIFNTRIASTVLVFLIVTLLTVYPLELFDYLILNNLSLNSIYSTYGLNTLLTNTLNRYHPFIFYTSVTLLFLITTRFYSSLISYTPFLKQKFLLSQFSLGWLAIQINLLALWMGSWWALQEGTWGGWWNWDSSEMFGLLVSTVLLVTLHSKLSLAKAYKNLLKLVIVNLIVIFSYFFIQLNFDLVSHNFGAKFFFFFNNNLFFLEVIFFAITLITVLTLYLFRQNNEVNLLLIPTLTIIVNKVWYYIRLIPATLFIYWLFWSYKPLINYFFWNFMGLNILNSETSLQPVNFLAMLIIWFWVSRFDPKYFVLTVTTLSVFTHWLPLLLFTKEPKIKILTLHSSLVLFAILNLLLYDLTPTTWIQDSLYKYHSCNTALIFTLEESTTLDNLSIELVRSWLTAVEYESVGWNLSNYSNSPAINFFSLNLEHSLFSNLYYLGFSYTNTYLLLEIPLLGFLNILFILLLYFTSRWVKTKWSRTSL